MAATSPTTVGGAEVTAMAHAHPVKRHQSAMSNGHRLAPLVAVLFAATAIVLAVGAAVTAAPTAMPDAGGPISPLVRGYYKAVNTALSTGDVTGLDAVVAPGEGRAGLARRLAAVHRARPGFRVAVERIVADRGGAVAWIALTGDATGGPVAVPIAIAGADELLDEFHVQNGKIVEVRGATPKLAAAVPIIRADLPPLQGPVLVGLARLELEPGAETPALSGPGPIAVAVEVGTLRMRKIEIALVTHDVPGGAGAVERIAGAVAVTLGPGDQLVLESGMPFRLRNEGEERAVALVAALFPVAATDRPDFVQDGLELHSSLVRLIAPLEGDPVEAWQGIAAVRLAGESLANAPAGSLRLEVDRAVLPPGTGLASGDPETRSVLAVERGIVLVRPERGDSAPSHVIGADGGATTAVPGAFSAIRGVGDGAASLLLVSLSSAPPPIAAR
jgi:hypothetical protein